MKILNQLMIALSTTLLLWSCSDDDSTNEENATISLSTQIIQMDKDGGDATVTVSSSGEWRLAGMCDWVHPSATSGGHNDVVTFTVDPNTLEEVRTATFKFFTGSSVIPLKVESSPAYVMDLLSDNEISVSNAESNVLVQLNTNIVEPAIGFSDGSEEWLRYNSRNDFGGKAVFTFIASPNETYKNRTATITISSPLTESPISVNVTQKQTDALIIGENTQIYDLTAKTATFEIKTNIDYKVSVTNGDSWITDLTVSTPSISDDGLSTATVSYKLSEATTTRGGTIRIVGTDSSLTSDIAVVQKDPNVQLAAIPDDALRSLAISNNWILAIAGSQCVILEAGTNATSLAGSYYEQIKDLTGIENFPNLTSIRVYCHNDMKFFDISRLHKVASLSINYSYNVTEYNLGDNPISSFNAGGMYSYSNMESIKVISSKVESIDLSMSPWYTDWDSVTSIDVSECPALTTLNANRSDKITTLYLKTGQAIPNLTKNEATNIVYK